MKLRKLIILAVAPMMCLAASAQDAPKKGDFTVAATAGYNSYTSVTTSSSNSSGYSPYSAYQNWNDKQMMVGIEGGWFFLDMWKLTLGGCMSITTNPGYAGIQGTGSGAGDIPTYYAVDDQRRVQYNVYTGVDRYFDILNVKGLMPYAGVRLGFAYGSHSINSMNDFEGSYTMGQSVAESFNYRAALTVGLDYFINEAVFIGIQADPFAYTRNRTAMIPQEGLSNTKATANNFGILAAPTIKFGFKF
jgi:outer membrane protein W